MTYIEFPGEGERIGMKTMKNILRHFGEDLDFLDKDEMGRRTKFVEGKCRIIPLESGFSIDLYIGRVFYRYSSEWCPDGDPEVTRFQRIIPYRTGMK